MVSWAFASPISYTARVSHARPSSKFHVPSSKSNVKTIIPLSHVPQKANLTPLFFFSTGQDTSQTPPPPRPHTEKHEKKERFALQKRNFPSCGSVRKPLIYFLPVTIFCAFFFVYSLLLSPLFYSLTYLPILPAYLPTYTLADPPRHVFVLVSNK